jgi:ABC-type branched-subunit amino acid transport system substrate-binding protein
MRCAVGISGGKSPLAPCFLSLVVCLLALVCCAPLLVRPTVKLGLVAPFEGRYRYVGYDVIYAVRLALREVNAAGGVGGYSVELVAYDDGADPAMAIEQARKLAVDPEVVAAMGHFREETTSAALNVYADAGIALVAPMVLDPAITEGEAQVYRLAPPARWVASALLQHLDESGPYDTALVTDGGPLATALQRLAPSHRVQVWPIVSPERTDWLEHVMTSNVEAVLCDADPVTAGEIISALRAAGWEGDFLGGPELAASDFAAVAKGAARGVVFVTPWPFPGDEAGFLSQDLASAYRAVSNGVEPGPAALPAYEATWVLLEALERDIAARGEPTRGGLAAVLPGTGREGGLGHIAFDADRDWDGAPLYWYRVGTQGPARLTDGE